MSERAVAAPILLQAGGKALDVPQVPFVDQQVLPAQEHGYTRESLIVDAQTMLKLMGLIKENQSVEIVGEFENVKSKIKIVGEGSELAGVIGFDYLNRRYRKLEKDAYEARALDREQLEITAAMHSGMKVSELGIKFASSKDDYLSHDSELDLWKQVEGETVVERLKSSELIKRYESQKIGYIQAFKNLKQVYGSTKAATEMYIRQTTLGKVLRKTLDTREEKSALLAHQSELLNQLPVENRGFMHKMKQMTNAIKRTIDKPLAPVEAATKAVVGVALYDYNPLVKLNEKMGNVAGKLWAETPVIPTKAKDGETEGKTERITMREAAARLEENLVIDPITGRGHRSGAITKNRTREAIVDGAAYAAKMNILPHLIAGIPAIEKINLNPERIYSMFRSSKMATGGASSVKGFIEKWKSLKTNKDKAILTSWVLGSTVAFYLAEKLAPTKLGINPVLMADVAMMKLSAEVSKETSKHGLEKTDIAETIEDVEKGINLAFGIESVSIVGERLVTAYETGSTDPLADIKSEEDLLEVVAEHPEQLRGDRGGVFGDFNRFTHELIQELSGVEEENNPWQTFAFNEGEVIRVDPGSAENDPIVIKQDGAGNVFEYRASEWVKVEIPEAVASETQNNQIDDKDSQLYLAEAEVAKSAVHDYVYFEPDTTKMAFRMDLVQGETWESKVDRLFEGYKTGGIDDPSGADYLKGKAIQGMKEDTAELGALAGEDGVYESQIYKSLISKLLRDAQQNGLQYDLEQVKANMVTFLKSDTTADPDTVEGEIDYGELYKSLFLGSEVTLNVGEIDTAIYKTYFLSGNEGTNKGVEVRISIPEDGTVSHELAEQGYGTGNGKIFNAQSEELEGATIYKIESDGSERLVSDPAELDVVSLGDEFVVRTGEGVDKSIDEGGMPEIIPLNDSGLSTFEIPPSIDQVINEETEWVDKVVRNENDEIYLGTVREGDIFSQMMVDRFEGVMDNSWDLLPMFQNMDANGIEIYAQNENGDRRYLNSYDDLGELYPGEKVILIDKNHSLSEIPDQESQIEIEIQKDDEVNPNSSDQNNNPSQVVSGTVGFLEDGKLDTDNLPTELIRDAEGYIYVGEIRSGMYISMLIGGKFPAREGTDAWEEVSELYGKGDIEILKISADGNFEKIEDINYVNAGDKIVIKDNSNLLKDVPSFDAVEIPAVPDPIEIIETEKSENLALIEIKQKLESEIAVMGDDVKVELKLIDLDNEANAMEFGEVSKFDAKSAQKIAIAMAVLRSIDTNALDLTAESRFVVLPGEYKPSIEHLLNLMLVHDDAVARDGLLKELVGQDMDALLGTGTGLKEILSSSEIGLNEVGMMYKTLLRTTYLSDDSATLLKDMINTTQSVNPNLLVGDLASIDGLEILEMSETASWDGSASDEDPYFTTFSEITTDDGKNLVLLMTADADSVNSARSAVRTVSRALMGELGLDVQLLERNELGVDVGQVLSDSSLAQRDFVSHLIYPYRKESGDYITNPTFLNEVKDISEFDLSKYEQTYQSKRDGSGVANLRSLENGDVITIFVDSSQQISSVFDSRVFDDSNIGYEVYTDSASVDQISYEPFQADSATFQIEVSREDTSGLILDTPQDRQDYIDLLNSEGVRYDFYIFEPSTVNGKPVIIYAQNDSDNRGSLPANLQVAFVGSQNTESNGQTDSIRAWEKLNEQLSRYRTVEDVVWQGEGYSFSQAYDESGPQVGHWFNPYLETITLGVEPVAVANTNLNEVVQDALGVVTPNDQKPIVDGVEFTKTIYIPDGMAVDEQVISRTNDIDLDRLVLEPTNDASVILVGEKVDQVSVDDPEYQATFTHPADELLYKLADGTLTPNLDDASETNPIQHVYPLTRPLDTYILAEKLVALGTTANVKIQYDGEPYFVESEDGKNEKVFVDPNSMLDYVKDGKDFVALVTDGHTFEEMAELYEFAGIDNTVDKIWERRMLDQISLEAREKGNEIVRRDQSLTVYSNDSSLEKVMTLAKDQEGLPIISADGNFVLNDAEMNEFVYIDGKFVPNSSKEIISIDKHLKDYLYLTNTDGQALHENGSPLLVKNDLIYKVSISGIELIGSRREFDATGFVSDKLATDLVTSWGVDKAIALPSESRSFANCIDDASKISHGLAIGSANLYEMENGVYDATTTTNYEVYKKDGEIAYDAKSGLPVLQMQNSTDFLVWQGSKWLNVDKTDITTKSQYLEANNLELLIDLKSNNELIDRRTQSRVYQRDGWSYIIGDRGIERIGKTDAVIKSGFVGFLDKDENYQTYTPENLLDIHGNPVYSPAERLSLLMNGPLNVAVGIQADVSNIWADSQIENVLPKIKNDEYVSFEQLPPQYIAALIAQENKTLFRDDEGEYQNLDLGVLAKVIMSLGGRGGSTLVQGLAKNVLMSAEERMSHSLTRKVSELWLADQLLEQMSVEDVVEMYANTISYGSIHGQEINGVEQASKVLFGKPVGDLSLAETSLLVAVPNFPNRNNVYMPENAVGWADSASGVARHMYENGFISESEMKQAFVDIHNLVLPSGSEEDIEYLWKNSKISSKDLAWVRDAAAIYQSMDFDARLIKTTVTESKELQLGMYGLAGSSVVPLAPSSVGVEPEVEKVVTNEYADFFVFLRLNYSDKFSEAQLEYANNDYFYYWKVLGPDNSVNPDTLEQDIQLGTQYTSRKFDENNPDYTPGVEKVDNDQYNVDPWSHRYEAIEKDADGESLSYSVVANDEEGKSIVQDEDGRLWTIESEGLVRTTGRVYQVDSGGAVQAYPASDRPGLIIDISGEVGSRGQYVVDNQGNYYSLGENNNVSFVGRTMINSAGEKVLFKLENNPIYEIATEPKDILGVAIKNLLTYGKIGGIDLNTFNTTNIPLSNDPNQGYVEPRNQGEYGLINPMGSVTYLDMLGIGGTAVELSARQGGRAVFAAYLTDMVAENKSVLVWINNDLASDVVMIQNPDKPYYESISRHEKPVSILQVFEVEGEKYIVYQDPTQLDPQVLNFDRFAELASPGMVGRFKSVVVGNDFALSSQYSDYLVSAHDQSGQVGMLIEDGYVYNYENPGAPESIMSINPDMQRFVTEEGQAILEQSGGDGFVAMAMDKNGRMPFYVALDSEGDAEPEMAFEPYQPGSIYKLLTAMWALHSGVDPNKYFEAGDYFEWANKTRTYNWTMDAETQLLRYAEGADQFMTIADGLIHSNNPVFLHIVDEAEDADALTRYAKSVGFGDGEGPGMVPAKDSIVPDQEKGEFSRSSVIVTGIGQAEVAVSPLEMLKFVAAIANNGKVVEPVLSRDVVEHAPAQLPNKLADYAVIQDAMERVASDPGGTAYRSFGDIQGYKVFVKTGTAEVGPDEDPNAWLTGYAEDLVTGEIISFVFFVKNGGEGSVVAAPVARAVLDKYFSDLQANRAMEGNSQVFVANEENITIVPTPQIESLNDLEKGVPDFYLENQPNKELIQFATIATRVFNAYVPSTLELTREEEAREFVDYLKLELGNAGFSDVVNSTEMQYAFDLLLNDYKSFDDGDGYSEPVQCVAWEVWLGQTQAILTGSPITMHAEKHADTMVSQILDARLQSGEPSPYGGNVLRFDNDFSDIRLMQPGDAFYIKYPGQNDSGHAGVVLAVALDTNGEPIVLTSSSNRNLVDGKIITDGKITLKWMTQGEFSAQFERQEDRYAGIAQSQIIVIRPEENMRVGTILTPVPILPTTSESNWDFVNDENGNLILPFEGAVQYDTLHTGEMREIEEIIVHWSGAASTDPTTWTADLVVNGLAGEESSSTFAIGIDKVLQLAKLSPTHVQETFASPWRHGAINLEIAGQDFDNYPPSEEQYERVLSLITELLITTNKPISIVMPHSKEIYLWSEDMPNTLGEYGNWVLIDSENLDQASYWEDSVGGFVPLNEFKYSYDPIIQKKIDPGEKFFARLIEDVKQELVAQGRSDLAEVSETVGGAESSKESIYTRIIDDEHPITREEIKQEIEPNLESLDAVDDVLAEASVGEDILIHSSSREDLKAMMHATRAEGVDLYIISGYRSFAEQLLTYLSPGNDEATVTQPGKSQHHTGLALDFTAEEIGFVVDEESGFEQSKAGIWLADNGWKYGYVQSYTKNHDGIVNEAWHYYYVGKEIAKIWHNSQQSQDPQDIFEILEQYQTGGIRSQ